MEQRISESSYGVFIIAATPFKEDGDIDIGSIDRLVEFYIEAGVSGMTVLGMMGEAPKLTSEEQSLVMRRFISRVDGRIPVVVGVSNAGLTNIKVLSEEAMSIGAAGVMVAPVGGLTTDDKLLAYFDGVFGALGMDIPVCYQDYPQATGVHISVRILNELIANHKNLVMFKHEDCPGLAKITKIREMAVSSGLRRLSVLCGNGGLYLPQELARGADGAMTGFAYPEMLVRVVALFGENKMQQAEDLFDAYLPLVRYEQQPGFGLAVRKEVLRRRGAIASAEARKPGPTLSRRDLQELSGLIERLERRLEQIA